MKKKDSSIPLDPFSAGMVYKRNNPNKDFPDWVYLLCSFVFSLVGGIYCFIKFRKKRKKFAWICLGLGILGFAISVLAVLTQGQI